LKAQFAGRTLLFALITVSCSTAHKTTPAASTPPPPAPAPTLFSLEHSDWQLLELAGAPIVPNSKPSLSFFEPGKVTGNASCNQFTGGVTITGNSLKFAPLATTMMACADPKISQQESTYLKALAAATRYEWHDPYLLIFCDGFEQPLQFSRAAHR
jgi:heat shock protein HslJ